MSDVPEYKKSMSRKMVKKSFFCVCSALIMGLIACGCINVEYVGQTFPQLPEGSQVIIYSKESPVPPDTYHAIGRVTMTAPDGRTLGDLRAELVDLARQHGAEAVSIVEFNRIQVGMESQNPSVPLQPGWRNDGRNSGGDFIYSNSFGDVTTVQKSGRPIIELQLKALLLVNNKRFNEIAARYREQRRKINEKAEAAGSKRAVLRPKEALDKAFSEPVKTERSDDEKKSDSTGKQPVQINLSDHRSAPAAL